MALSISPVERWDFQAASTPLVGQVAGATLVNGAGASVNTTDGLVISAGNSASSNVASLPSAIDIARPITIVIGVRFIDVNAPQSAFGIVAYGDIGSVQALGLTGQTTIADSDSAQIRLTAPNVESATATPNWAGLANTTEHVVVITHTSTTKNVWVNGVNRIAASGTYSGSRPNNFRIGKALNLAVAWHTPWCAIFDAPLSAGDITALGSTFASARAELFASGPSAAAIHDYLTLNGLTPGV